MYSLSSPIVPDGFFSDSYDNEYIVTSPPENLAVPIRDLKEQLRLPLNITTEDVYLSGLLSSAIQYAENYTKRDFITRSYVTFRDCFHCCITIKRSILQQVLSIKYLEGGVLKELDPESYYVTQSNTYSSIYPTSDTFFSGTVDCRKQAVQIAFTAGYGDSPLEVPEALRSAILNHAARLYVDRGDCKDIRRGREAEDCLPCNSRLIYDQFKIVNIFAREAC